MFSKKIFFTGKLYSILEAIGRKIGKAVSEPLNQTLGQIGQKSQKLQTSNQRQNSANCCFPHCKLIGSHRRGRNLNHILIIIRSRFFKFKYLHFDYFYKM
jgi:hypothetical protein